MLTIEEAVAKIKAYMPYTPPEGRPARLRAWLGVYGPALDAALDALPAEEREAIGLDRVRAGRGVK